MNQPTELPPTDLLLLERIASGDRASFDLFVTRMERLVYSTVYKVLNDRQDTEDVSQEVFFQVWQKAGLYNAQRGKPTTWVATMARNRDAPSHGVPLKCRRIPPPMVAAVR